MPPPLKSGDRTCAYVISISFPLEFQRTDSDTDSENDTDNTPQVQAQHIVCFFTTQVVAFVMKNLVDNILCTSIVRPYSSRWLLLLVGVFLQGVRGWERSSNK